MKHVIATLRDTEGYQRDYEYDIEDELIDSLVFMWEDGNYACDCNRSLFLYEWDESRELKCNSGSNEIKLVSLVCDGEVYYEDANSRRR